MPKEASVTIQANLDNLYRAVDLMFQKNTDIALLPENFPTEGLGDQTTLEILAPHVFGKAADLGSPIALAHMDPPTLPITWAATLWNASLNQNLLHPATSPFASSAEEIVINWLCPFCGMSGGHFCSGSTIGNLTALWAARDQKGIKQVVCSVAAHNSIEKACKILGIKLTKIPVDQDLRLRDPELDLKECCLVLTAGATGNGAIDPLVYCGKAAWTHIDAAWAGPFRLAPNYSYLLDGIDGANSVVISGHKLLFQPKDSALILFKDYEESRRYISLGGNYLARPTVGVQGSRSANAIPLLATLMALGRNGIAMILGQIMSNAENFYQYLVSNSNFTVLSKPVTGITIFRPNHQMTSDFLAKLPQGMFATFLYEDKEWVRSVSANPKADIPTIISYIERANSIK